MSNIRYSVLSLSEIIEESNLIVEVRCIEPYSEEVPVKNKSTEGLIPAFSKKGWVFSIKNILKNTTGVKVGETIRVPNENWRRSLAQHNEQYANGVSKSYQVKKYETDVSSIKAAKVLFLYHFQGMFELTAKDSFDSETGLEKLDLLL